MPDDIKDDPIETVALSSTIEYMVAHTQSSGKTKTNVEDMFVAILKDEKNIFYIFTKKIGNSKSRYFRRDFS